MTSLSVSDCCHLFAIDPKTLRQWLAQAQMSLHTHPTDARIKCLTSEQVYLLAGLHGRVLQASELAPTSASPKPGEAQSRVPPTSFPDADLRARLVQMETQVATLQAQLDFPDAPIAPGAGAAHRASSAGSGSSVHLDWGARAANAVHTVSVSKASVGLPSQREANTPDPAH